MLTTPVTEVLMRPAIAVILGFCTLGAHAVLIDLGDTTLDSRTGLQWLDVTESQGFSYNQIVSGAGGFIADGWRFATGNELRDLSSFYVGTADGLPSSDVLPLVRGTRALALLGITLSVNNDLGKHRVDDPNDPWLIATLGIFDDQSPANCPGLAASSCVGFGEIVLRDFNPGFEITWQSFDDFFGNDSIAPQVGAFLVRQVPEPSTVGLLAMGLLGLGFMRRKTGGSGRGSTA